MDDAERKAREIDARIAVALQIDLPSPMGECPAVLRMPHKDDGCAPGTYWLVQRSGMSLRTAPPYKESIAAALREAEARGMGRAAGIAREYNGLTRVIYRNKEIPMNEWPNRIADAIERAAKEVG